jgi:diguanylate cyclase (GGDEF)-like protein
VRLIPESSSTSVALSPPASPPDRDAEIAALRSDLAAERSSRANVEMALETARRTDPLTGLPNRLALAERLSRAFARGEELGSHTAVLLIDIDRFASVNDALGPETGDMLLQLVGQRLTSAIRGDSVYRVSGDEFVVVLEGLTDPSQALATSRNLQRVISAPMSLGERPLALTATIGLSVSPEDGLSADEVLQGADIAMRGAKRAGVHLRRRCNIQSGVALNDLLDLETDLRGAIERGELQVAYQPRLCVATNDVLGAEALLRWHHPTRGDISPDIFIPIAERARLIDEIGRWALTEACIEATGWGNEGIGDLPVAVNLSPGQVTLQLLADVEHALDESGLAPERLELELTESLLVEGGAAPALLLETLSSRGIRIALDDFGTGYSNLGYLPSRRHVEDRPLLHPGSRLKRRLGGHRPSDHRARPEPSHARHRRGDRAAGAARDPSGGGLRRLPRLPRKPGASPRGVRRVRAT